MFLVIAGFIFLMLSLSNAYCVRLHRTGPLEGTEVEYKFIEFFFQCIKSIFNFVFVDIC